MSDVRLSNEYYHLVYDPLIHGYTDSFFYTASGTPAISTNVLRFNAASCYTTGQFLHGEYEFGFNIAAPSDASLICAAAGSTAITVWDQVSDGEFAVTIDGTDYDVTGLDFTNGTYTPALLTGGNAATSTIDTWAAVTNGGFDITINGTLRHITGIDFKTSFPYTPAYLTGGNAATSAIDTWAAVTDGRFAITIDGVLRTVSGVDFKTAFPYTPAYLTGGSGATTDIPTWAAVLDGSFSITLDGAVVNVADIDFSAATTMEDVAAAIQAKLRTATGNLETVVWSTDHFIISSVNTTVDSAITVLSATGGGTDISGAGATAFMDSEVARGTVTAHATTKTMADVATLIQTAIRTLTTSTETVVWSTDHFVISSVNTTVDSAITVASTTAGGTDISGAGATNFLDSDTGNGVVTVHATTKTMADVAALIQTAVRTATSSTETVVWSTNHFVISSVDTTSTSAITVASSPAAGTDISGVGATTFMDAEVAVGVVTVRAMANAMDYVASIIQSSVVALTGDADTVTYDTDHFVFTTDNTGGVSSITVLSAVSGGSGTDISGAAYLNGLTGVGTVTTGTTKEFGLKLPSFVGKSSILFQVFGSRLICRSYDGVGGTEYVSIPWETAWSGTATPYKIIWLRDRIEFWVNGVSKAILSEKLPSDISLSVYISNADSNNQDLSYLYFKGVEKANPEFTAENVNVELNPGDIEIGAVELKDSSTDTRAIINAANTARAATNPVVLVQPLDASGSIVGAAIPTTITGGSKTVAVAGTAEALGATLSTKSIYIRAKGANTSFVCVGDSTVDKTTNQQIVLYANDSVTIDVANRMTVYIDADVSAEGVDYLCMS